MSISRSKTTASLYSKLDNGIFLCRVVYGWWVYSVFSWQDSGSSSRTARTRLAHWRSSTVWSAATAAHCSQPVPVASTHRRTRTSNQCRMRIHFGKQHHQKDRHFQSPDPSCVSLVELEFTAGDGGGGGGGLGSGLGGGQGAGAAGGPTPFGRDTPDASQQFCCCVILWWHDDQFLLSFLSHCSRLQARQCRFFLSIDFADFSFSFLPLRYHSVTCAFNCWHLSLSEFQIHVTLEYTLKNTTVNETDR